MYKKQALGQQDFHKFELSFGYKMDPENRWVLLAKIIPWDKIEEKYGKLFSEKATGAPAKTSRIAFGSLYLKEKLGVDDREGVEQLKENPYLQWFVGLYEFKPDRLFDPSLMVYFRKRFTQEILAEINNEIALHLKAMEEEAAAKRKAEKRKKKKRKPPETGTAEDDGCSQVCMTFTGDMEAETEWNNENPERVPDPEEDEHAGNKEISEEEREAADKELREKEHKGKVILDATCAPADIKYPTDLGLLNEAREKTEVVIDTLYEDNNWDEAKPRTNRRKNL